MTTQVKKKVTFRDEHSLEERKAEAERIRAKYPDRIPVIVEQSEKSSLPPLDKRKYLLPADLTVGQFVYVIRKRVKLAADQAIFLFVNNTLPSSSALISQLYEKNKDDAGFLTFLMSGESTFGRF